MQVTALKIYPVKSFGGYSVDRADIRPRGLKGDRRYMLVDADGGFITARTEPKLLAVAAQLTADGLKLNGPDGGSVTADTRADQPVDVSVWNDIVAAYPVSGPVNAWLSGYLGRECTLFHMTADVERPITDGQPGDMVSFADAYPMLITTEISLKALNETAGEKLTMTRFRPNIVLDGDIAWGEYGWTSLTIGGIAFDIVSPCERCVLTTIDPDTRAKHPRSEPLRALAKFKRSDAGKVLFGVNAIPRGTGVISVGDGATPA